MRSGEPGVVYFSCQDHTCTLVPCVRGCFLLAGNKLGIIASISWRGKDAHGTCASVDLERLLMLRRVMSRHVTMVTMAMAAFVQLWLTRNTSGWFDLREAR